MNKQDSPIESNVAASRIDDSAARVKQATSSAVAGTKDAVDRAAEHVDHAADKVEEGLHRTTDKAADAAHWSSDKAADLGERGREAYARTADQAEEWLEAAREYVREKPVQSVAIALGAGWLVGRILRR